MEEKLSVKVNAVELLEKQLHLRALKGQHGIIVMSSATDPYLQAEKETGLTRQLLEVILKYRFPVHIITKSDLVTRDFDLLGQIDRTAILPADLRDKLKRGTIITFSFTTVDDAISGIFEPGATSPTHRLIAHQTALKHNFLSGISMMPLLPYITDTTASLEAMYTAFKKSGSQYVMPATITLSGSGTSDSRTLVFRAIDKHYPHLSEKYRKLFADGWDLPRYYSQAFAVKARVLSIQFELPLRIL